MKRQSEMKKQSIPYSFRILVANSNIFTDAVVEIKKALNNRIPLIGFSGSPFTLACYMVEGGSSSSFQNVKENDVSET